MKDQEYDYFYDDEQDAKYCYPGTNILKNKLDIRDLDILHEAERDFSSVRQAELSNMGVTGDFSFKHLCAIHKQLFQDVYSWAGKTRTVDISKPNSSIIETIASFSFLRCPSVGRVSTSIFKSMSSENLLINL